MDEVGEFEELVAQVEPRLRRALVATYGFERGREATAEALGWAWEHRQQLPTIENKVAYLYRVGQTRSRKRREPKLYPLPEAPEPWFEPGLAPALEKLSERQRVAVILVYGFAWTLQEVAELTGTRLTTVQTHLERGMQKLRTSMEVTNHA
ncbi:MAG: RNA polymerase sigma factor [Acidimicrobiales bacterium]